MTPPPGLVVITGSSSGIGQACAHAFSKAGYPLLLLSRRGCTDPTPIPQARYEKVDVANAAAIRKAIAQGEEEIGPVEGIINNAGFLALGEIHRQPHEEIGQMVNANLMGVVNGTQAVIPGMIQRKRGTIINISSVAGRHVYPFHAAYNATKFAVHGFSEAVRKEVAKHGVRCLTVAPGMVETAVAEPTSDKEKLAKYTSLRSKMPGVIQPREMADLILYIYQLPSHICVREIVLAPTAQEP